MDTEYWKPGLVERALINMVNARRRMSLQEICEAFDIDPEPETPKGATALATIEVAILTLVAHGVVLCDEDIVWMDIPTNLHDAGALEAWLNDC